MSVRQINVVFFYVIIALFIPCLAYIIISALVFVLITNKKNKPAFANATVQTKQEQSLYLNT